MKLDDIRAHIKPLDFHDLVTPSEEEQEYFHFYGIDLENYFDGVSHHFGVVPIAGFDIACHYFRQEQACGTCYVLHGYFDHAGLYRHLIRYCLNAKQNIIVIDLPGHGLSSGPRASIDAFSDYVSVLEEIVSKGQVGKTLPAHFIGQSTGAAVIMHYLLGQRYKSDGISVGDVVLLAPLVRPVNWAYLRLAFGIAHRFMQDIPRKFSENSHDKQFLNFLKTKDSLQFRSLPIQWVRAMRGWLAEFHKLPICEHESILVVQGEQDGTVDWRYNVKQIKKKFPFTRVHFLKQGRHHLVNESKDIRDKVFAQLDNKFGQQA